jgi:hypothetical protein
MAVNFAYDLPLSYLYGSLAFLKISRHEAYGFTFPEKEVVLRIFIVIVNRPRPGLNPQTLGPMARALTTRPPWETFIFILAAMRT